MSYVGNEIMMYTRSRDTNMKILGILALEGECCQYNLPKKLGKSYRTILRRVQDLEMNKLIKIIRTERSAKKGKERKIYSLTFRGLIEFLFLLFKNTPKTPEEDKRWLTIKHVVKNFNQYDDYPLFKQLEVLEKWVGERDFYNFLMALAWLLKTNPPHIAIEVKHGYGDLALFIQKLPFPEFSAHPSVSEAYVYGFTYMFFLYAWHFRRKEAKEGPFINPTLHKLAQETFDKRLDTLKKEIEELKKLKVAYGTVFPPADTSI